MENMEINQVINEWLLTRFKDSWWKPSYKIMSVKIVSQLNIKTYDEAIAAVNTNEPEKIIEEHLQRMLDVLRSTKTENRVTGL